MKVLTTFKDFFDEKKKELEALGYEFFYEKESKLEFKPYMEEVEVLVCYNPFNNVDIKRFKNLKWIQLSTVGIDQISQEVGEYIDSKGIIVTNNKGGYGIPIGEWIVMNILELSRNTAEFNESRREKKWKPLYDITEIYGKKVVIIGTGNIAIEAAKRLKPFEVELIGVNTDGREVEHFNRCFDKTRINEAVAEGDFIVITLPSTDKTQGIIDEKVLSAINKQAYFINVSRGRVVDEEALIKKLKVGDIKGAALDVFKEEPLPKESPLWDLKNVIITPHNSWVSENGFLRRNKIIQRNLEGYARLARGEIANPKEALINITSFKKGY